MISIKALAESPGLTSIPSSYTITKNPHDQAVSDLDNPIPIIDYSLLNSSNPDQRSKTVQDLRKACEDWGFFMVINHGVPESLMKEMIEACGRFFNLTDEEKREFEGKHVLDPIRCGTSINATVNKVFLWRDFLKVFVHPEFHSPNKPAGFSEISLEYCNGAQEVARELLKGISESLGFYKTNLELGFQLLGANFYPPCPQPELAMGILPHSDHGLLTLLIQNEVGGLQVKHKGKWVNVNYIPNSFLVNTGDHIEILSNGKYKSVVHRAVVNNKAKRISIALAHGPSLETVVSPAAELLEKEKPAYIGMKYKEYLELQQHCNINESALDRVRVATI